MKKIAFHTLGCKLNFSETSTLSRQIASEGYQVVGFDRMADIYVINSCSVTQNAEKRCREWIKKAMKINPEAHVAVVGCYSQINPEKLKTIPGVSMVLGNADKFNLFEHIGKLKTEKKDIFADSTTHEPVDFVPGYSVDGRTRSFFKIQDGCDYFCSYCTIPHARGRSRSNTIADTLKTAHEIAQTNIKEVVLSGVNIGDFGKNHGESFLDFLKELVKVKGLERIRISSIEPNLLNDDIIELVADNELLMPHFHIPLQAGSDKVLRDMRRKYDTALFLSRVNKIREVLPHACIAIDVITGFPTETDALFRETYDFLKEIDVSYMHVFTYSERDNTRAVHSMQKVPVSVRSNRSKALQLLSGEKKSAFYKINMNTTSPVLWEKENNDSMMYGFTENYIKVKTPFDNQKVNTIERVSLNFLDSDEVYFVGK